ncbi:MAG: hypothetical protein CMB13_03250 [Euryarchaeota archaeon]|nr:hypothetical protein [Euryarchaeota archaeon]|tara:strand:+ start:67 stop:393 length:327 start_codon:yes stop_codon:yes gene_type:complete
MIENVVRAYTHLPGVVESWMEKLDGTMIAPSKDGVNGIRSWTTAERLARESGLGQLQEWWIESDQGAVIASKTGDDSLLWLKTDSPRRLGRCAHEVRRTRSDLANLLR